MPTTPLLPLPDGLDNTAICETEEGLLLAVRKCFWQVTTYPRKIFTE